MLCGEEGNDLFEGWMGHDTLDGGDGDDTLLAGLGHDTLAGGDGSDRFRLEPVDSIDTVTITDFNPALDVIDLRLGRTDAVTEPYAVAVVDWADGNGADVSVNGVVFAQLAGAQGLDPSLIELG